MFLTYVRHRVKDYAIWRKAFDANAPMLEKNGVLGTWIVQKQDDPNDVMVINTWPGAKNWDDFIASHKFTGATDIKKHQEKGGVIGEPEFVSGNVVE